MSGDDGKPRKQAIKEEIPQIVEIPAKLFDANKDAELLGKKYTLFTNKEQDIGEPIEIVLGRRNDTG